MSFQLYAEESVDYTQVILHVYDIDPTHGQGSIGKSPVLPPYVGLGDSALYFGDCYPEAVPVELTDATGNVVYSDCLPAGTQTLSLPTTLSGTYTLFIYMGNYIFAGLITL